MDSFWEFRAGRNDFNQRGYVEGLRVKRDLGHSSILQTLQTVLQSESTRLRVPLTQRVFRDGASGGKDEKRWAAGRWEVDTGPVPLISWVSSWRLRWATLSLLNPKPCKDRPLSWRTSHARFHFT